MWDNPRKLIVSLPERRAKMNEGEFRPEDRENREPARNSEGRRALPDYRALSRVRRDLAEPLVGRNASPKHTALFEAATASAARARITNDPRCASTSPMSLNQGRLYQEELTSSPPRRTHPGARRYVAAQELLEGLVRDFPDNVRYKQALARAQERL